MASRRKAATATGNQGIWSSHMCIGLMRQPATSGPGAGAMARGGSLRSSLRLSRAARISGGEGNLGEPSEKKMDGSLPLNLKSGIPK